MNLLPMPRCFTIRMINTETKTAPKIATGRTIVTSFAFDVCLFVCSSDERSVTREMQRN